MAVFSSKGEIINYTRAWCDMRAFFMDADSTSAEVMKDMIDELDRVVDDYLDEHGEPSCAEPAALFRCKSCQDLTLAKHNRSEWLHRWCTDCAATNDHPKS